MALAGLTLLLSLFSNVHARNYVNIASAVTLYPYVEAVAETIASKTGYLKPQVTLSATGSGLQDFCAGIGSEYPDIVGASRRIERQEIEVCIENGVADIIEIPVGYEGIVLVQSRASSPLPLNLDQLYRALARTIPNVDHRIASTPNKTRQWNELNPSLAKTPIQFAGPEKDTDLYRSLVDLLITRNCMGINPYAASLQQRRADLSYIELLTLHGLCGDIRDDRHYQSIKHADVTDQERVVEDDWIVRQLAGKPQTIGIISYSSLAKHKPFIKALPVDDIIPTPATIASGQYPLVQPLFLYVKKAHLEKIPGLWDYIAFFTSEGLSGPRGQLVKNGLVALSFDERSLAQAELEAQKTIQRFAVVE